jgi:hypothetical protein
MMDLEEFNNMMSFLNIDQKKSKNNIDFQHNAIDIVDYFMKLNYPKGTMIKHDESLIATGKMVEVLKYIDLMVVVNNKDNIVHSCKDCGYNTNGFKKDGGVHCDISRTLTCTSTFNSKSSLFKPEADFWKPDK